MRVLGVTLSDRTDRALSLRPVRMRETSPGHNPPFSEETDIPKRGLEVNPIWCWSACGSLPPVRWC